ncbi:MAG: BglG family transcription antiterminator [Anaerorhabdus sp.]|uniref:BglG family transcription antiterminator n=1 Tax=Anaerorhabdus sp. TaxID=1872524 RepID=UPI002FC99F57
MNENRCKELFDILLSRDYVTSEELASILEVSSRTIRSDLKDLSEQLINHGVEIISKPKYGNKLHILNQKKLDEFITEITKDEEECLIPSNSQERVQYLLEYLLAADSFVKIDDLCESLYISKSSISQDLKEVRKLLEEYNLKLIQKPSYGIKVEGKEFDFRLCITNQTISRLNFNDMSEDVDKKHSLKSIAEVLTSVFDEYHFRMSDVSFQNLIVHIYIAMKRIQESCYVPMDQEQMKRIQEESEFVIAEAVVSKLITVFNIEIPESETGYIAIHLASKKIIEFSHDGLENVIIDNEISEIVTHMLNEVHDAFKIDFRDDLELRMVLALHLVPFGVRIRYDMILRNPLLKEIKTRFTLAYSIAVSACDILKKRYHKDIQEDEIGYFALHFNLALERKRNVISKKNVLIVCSTGRGTAELLVYKFREEFGKYINKIETCDSLSINKIDFTNIDYLITTVPIIDSVPVPILEVKYFLEDSDVSAVRKMLSKEKTSSLIQYFDERLFLCNLDFKNKEDVLHYMTKKIKEVKEVPTNFYQKVMKREHQAITEFGNLVAIPHPYKAVSKETFVCIAILNKPIIWDKKKVQLIYLLSIEDSVNKNLQTFYKITSKLLLNQDYVKKLIAKKDYQVLLQIFNTIESDLK